MNISFESYLRAIIRLHPPPNPSSKWNNHKEPPLQFRHLEWEKRKNEEGRGERMIDKLEG